jgi:outer membrane receptor protein involved in Fe transport
LKQQLTAQDSVYVRLSYYDSEAGDVSQYYDQSDANPLVRTREYYEPTVLAGYHHEWNPGNHTLLLAGRLANIYEVNNPFSSTLFFNRGFATNPVQSVSPVIYDQRYRSELTFYTAELQQLWQIRNHTAVLGGRFQTGEFDTCNRQTGGELPDGSSLVGADQNQTVTADLQRQTIYLYDQWQALPRVLLVGGVSYDWVRFPENHRFAPVSVEEETRDQLSPKAGLIWTPTDSTTVRGAYYRALGGASLDQSVRLEPSQVAGFNQAYRSLIPESVASANSAPEFESWAVSLEQKIKARTFFAVSAENLSSEVDRTVGVVERIITIPPFSAQSTREQLDFRERSLFVTLHQLLGDEFSMGARYRLSYAELEDRFPDIPRTARRFGGFETRQNVEARLHQLNLFLGYNHPSGFFGNTGAIWTEQSNYGYGGQRPGDDFWQFNIEAGYRFLRRRVEVRVALLNVLDQDYQLNPLNLTPELPRERTFAASLRFNF